MQFQSDSAQYCELPQRKHIKGREMFETAPAFLWECRG